MPVDSFDWIRWRNLSIFSLFNFKCRTDSLLQNKYILRKYAVGYIPGWKLFCRPKENTVAVMFLINDEFEWCHLRKCEFEKIFGDDKNG